MRFLDLEQCEQWSTAHGYGLKDRLPLPEPRGVVRATVRTPREDPPSRALASALQRALGDWPELLVWATQTSVYRYHDETFAIASLLTLAGETRPPEELPGQLLVRGEELALRRVLLAAVELHWYAYFFPASVGGQPPPRWVRTTWDHYVRVTSSIPGGVDEFVGEMRRLGLKPVLGLRTEEGEWVEAEAAGG